MTSDPEESKHKKIRNRLLIGTASNYVGQIVSFASLFLLTPFILHKLGATAYGLWILIGSLVAYASLLDFGIWGAIVKYIAEFRARGEHEQAQALTTTALGLYALLGLAIFLVCLAAAPFLPQIFKIPADQRALASRLIVLMGVGVGVSLPGMMPMAVLRGLQRYDLVNAVDVTTTILTAIATVVVLLFGGGVFGLVLVNIAGIFVILVLSTWAVHRIAPEIRIGWRGVDRNQARFVISYSWPLFIKDMASRLKTKTDEITIGAFLPVGFVAPYSLARRLSESTNILTQQFMKVLLPLASELHAEEDLGRLRLLYTAGTRLALAISVAIGGTLIVLARPILTFWVGKEYSGFAYLVVILTTASFIATCQWPAGAILQGMARHRILAFTSLASGLANLALSIALVRPFGLAGVAFGTLIPSTIEFSILLPYTMKVIGVRRDEALREIFFPALVPAILLGLFLYIYQQYVNVDSLFTILAGAGLGIALYAAGYYLLGASRLEKQTYRQILSDVSGLARAQLARWRAGASRTA